MAASEELLTAARETIEVAQAARASDEHDRKVRQLRDIGHLAESLFWQAVRDAEVKPRLYGWRMIEHNYLEQALVGMAEALPKSVALTQTNSPRRCYRSGQGCPGRDRPSAKGAEDGCTMRLDNRIERLQRISRKPHRAT